jgi:hypothetical protein
MRVPRAGLRYVATVAALLAVAGADASSDPSHRLRVTATLGGTVSTVDGRIRCGSACSAVYRSGKVVLLRAASGPYGEFERWTGDCIGTAPRCAVVVDRAVSVGAIFFRYQTQLAVSVGGPGVVYSEPEGLACGVAGGPCAASFPAGETVILSPVPRGDSAFRAWGAPCSGETTRCTLRVSYPSEVTAAFQAAGAAGAFAPLTLAVRGRPVTSDPAGVACPPTCEASFPGGALVTLRGVGRYSWEGDCVGFTAACTLVADRPREVRATGELPPPPPPGPQPPPSPPPPPAPAPRLLGVSVSVSGRGLVVGAPGIRCGRTTGTVFDCSAAYRRGQHVTLRAVPARRSRFVRWSGFCVGQKKECVLRVTSPKIVIATFGQRHDR